MQEAADRLAIAQRVALLSERAEAAREVWEDAVRSRDQAIFSAIDEHGAKRKDVAGWAKLAESSVSRVVYLKSSRAS